MRSIWKGAISFGLVSIPVRVFGATENHSVSFRQVHAADGGRIRYRKVCELEDEEVSTSEITKAFEAADGTTVPLTDEDLSSLPLPTARTIEILAFVPADTIDPLQLDRSYYLGADGGGAAKPYVLLREALTRSEKVAVVKLALRGRETLGMLRVVDDALALHTMLWPDEIRSSAGVAPETDVAVRDAELDLADTLMDTLGDIDLDSLHDEYREAVEALVAAKLEGVEPAEAGGPPEAGGKVIDLMAALENSVRAAQESRGGDTGARGGEEAGDETGETGEGSGGEVKELRGAAAKKSGGGKAGAKGSGTGGRAAKKAASPAGKGSAGSKGAAEGKQAAAGGTSGGGRTAAKKTSAKKTTGEKAGGRTGSKAGSKAGGESGGRAGSRKSTAKKAEAEKAAPRKRARAG
ncbi:non-homologous end joining protein Ku [Streptomyces lycii]|uniref:Non-homologous end joining protein Ku n=2 Tax=Streptomyces TaxID=1883 RepID=A0ABQ7FE21_9ACTN|nr:Ku protein [Streptomyces lycii]KAF4405518.1 Ku protein [Streptomyces lycii]